MRAFTAGGVAGSVTYGTPQPPEPETPLSTVLARAATATSSLSTPATKTATPATIQLSPEAKVLMGETAFRNADYAAAIEDWKTALAAGPRNPVLVLLLSQAYFADGDYQNAAAAAREAMQSLSKDRWGVVVSNRRELYAKPNSYSFQLAQLEIAVNEHPRDPAQRFLLAFHYASLGYPQAAVGQLDKVLELEPRDQTAAELRKFVALHLPAGEGPVITPGVVTPAFSR